MGKNSGRKHGEKSDRALKSKMVPKKCVLDFAFSEEDGGDELRYLENLKAVKVAAASGDYDNVSVDMDDEEEDSVSDHENEGNKGKKLRKDSPDFPNETKREKTLTSRQWALLSGTDFVSTASQIEFPNGLSYAPPQKQKEKFTEVERQLKKDEAAERRRIQNEKAAQESEAEAIGKKRENQLNKHQEETAQEKAANAKVLAPSTIRTVIGPTGTTVEFAEDIGLPHIFDPTPTCYPPPREKCAGPSCTNVYKYRDSKSNLPLCSLQCYKAVHAMMLSESSI